MGNLYYFFTKTADLINRTFYSFINAVSITDKEITGGGAPDINPDASAIDPIYDAMSTFGPALIGLLAAVMSLYAAIMGFSYSKAEDADARDAAKKKLINGLIGFGVILILIVILYALRSPIAALIRENQ